MELREQVVTNIFTLLPQVLRREVSEVTEHTLLMEELGLTSSSTLELLLDLEDRLGIEINVEEINDGDVDTVGALADYIAGHVLTDA